MDENHLAHAAETIQADRVSPLHSGNGYGQADLLAGEPVQAAPRVGRTVRITIEGQPIGKARAKVTRFGTYTPAKTRRWTEAAKFQASQQLSDGMLQGALRLDVVAYFVPAKGWPNWKLEAAYSGQIGHTAKPDKDNIEKAVSDALNGLAWEDDSQIVEGETIKRYSKTPRIEVTISELRHMAPSNTKTLKALERWHEHARNGTPDGATRQA